MSLNKPLEEVVDQFADAMKAKLAEKQGQGYTGWDDPKSISEHYLYSLLNANLREGDLIDVANLAMIIWHRNNL